MLYDFFRKELPQYLTPELSPLGRQIIETCLAGKPVEEYNKILPMDYQYAITHISSHETVPVQ